MNFKKRWKRWLVIMMLTTGAFIPYVQAPEPMTVTASEGYADLSAQLRDILKDERIKGAIAGVSVRKAEDGELLFSNFGDIRLHPASNMKLLTGAAALEILGPDHRFATEVLADGKVNEGTLKGDLYLKGKGDPTLLKEDFDQLAEAVKKAGIRVVNGNLIADDSWYDNVRLSQDLNWSDESFYTGSQISALTASPNTDYDSGTVIVAVNPGSEGEPAKVTLDPYTDYVTIVNKAKTVAEGGKKDITIEREHGTNNIIVEGTIPVKGTQSRSWVAVWEPTGYALDLFKKSLEEAGVQFTGHSKAGIGVAPKDATLVASKDSMPLKELMIPFMKLSNNGHAEVLVKELGRKVYGEGSWDKGLEVLEEAADGWGMDTSTMLLRDGSGMSHKNMIPADELSKMLYAVQEKPYFDEFLNSLPVAGASDRMVGGTLRNRLKNTAAENNVKAKTGSLTAVSSLSGYVTTKAGEEIIFSIMINNDLTTVTPIEDAIATTIANYNGK